MRIAFFGTPAAAVPALEAFLGEPETEVVAVVTNPDRPAGRGYKLVPPPVKTAALEAGLEVWQPEKPRERLADLRALGVDACAVVAYGALLPQDVLDAGGQGFVNLHFSLLPKWRGAAPVQHSILSGDPVTGVTCFVLDKGMDTGPVLSTLVTEIGSEETAGELTLRLALAGGPELVRAVQGLVDGSLVPMAQDDTQATYAPKISTEDARIGWAADAEVITLAVRAYNPVPGAHTTFEGARLKVHRARPVVASGPAGKVIALGSDGPVVGCGVGALCLTEVQPAGKPRMDGAAFARGYPCEGAVLGLRE